jgi:hypothetical protein
LKNGEKRLRKGRETEKSLCKIRIIDHPFLFLKSDWKLRAPLKGTTSGTEKSWSNRKVDRRPTSQRNARCLPPMVDHVDNMAHDSDMANSSKSDRILAASSHGRESDAQNMRHHESVITPNLDKIENPFLSP